MKLIRQPIEYETYKIVPTVHIRNNASYRVAQSICTMYNGLLGRLTINKSKYFNVLGYDIEVPLEATLMGLPKVSYYIYISKSKVEFYFIIPKQFKQIFLEAVMACWSSATLFKVEQIPLTEFNKAKQLKYRHNSCLSLNVDRRDNDLISSNLAISELLNPNECIGIYYNFIPINFTSYPLEHKNALKAIKDKGISTEAFDVMRVLRAIINFVDEVLNIFNTNYKNDLSSETLFAPSNESLSKSNENILGTQIVLLSHSDEPSRAYQNIKALGNSFRCIDGDNMLVPANVKQIELSKAAYELSIPKVSINKMSVKECHNFLSLPSRELLEQYKMVEHIDTLEVNVPDELAKGYISLGESIYKGNSKAVYLSTHKNFINLPVVALGPQGSGKTTFCANYAKCCVGQKENVIVIDYININELADAIEGVTPSQNICRIDLNKYDSMQAFGFNEVNNLEYTSIEEKLEFANMQTQLMMQFVDAINPTKPLEPRMRNNLNAAGNIVFIHKGTCMRDVKNVLVNYRERQKYLVKVPKDMEFLLQDEILTLQDMNEVDKDGNITGTKSSKVDFIIDRLSVMVEDTKMKAMFNKPINNNVDFVKEMEAGKTISIRMLQAKYSTENQRNILATFYLSKIWFAAQIINLRAKGKPTKRTHIIIDEIYQAPTAELMLKKVFEQCRKFQLKFLLSAHSLQQINVINDALKGAGASYMLFKGLDKSNFYDLKEELAPFELEDLQNIKMWHSLNLVQSSNGYEKIITKLPNDV